MKRLFSKLGVVGFIVALVTISFCFTTMAAEKKKFSMSTKREKWISENLLVPYGDPSQMRLDFQRYELKQGVSLDMITDSTDPNLIGAEQTVYWLRDRVAGHPLNESAIIITRSKDGDCIYAKWESIFKRTKVDMLSVEFESESSFQFIGGTGKFSDIKGSAYSGDIGHLIRRKPAICSGSFRPVVPGDSGPPVGAERRWGGDIFDRKIKPSQALISFSWNLLSD